MKRYFFTSLLVLCAVFANAGIIQNFENILYASSVDDPSNAFFVYNANFAPMEIVTNPNSSGLNTSQKVVKVQVYTNAPNSGIIKINFTGSSVAPIWTYPACPSCNGAKYDKIRFKYYKGSLLNRYVELEPNGSAASPKKIVQGMSMDQWEYITFDLDFSTYTTFQIRVNRNGDGTGSAIGTASGDFIYIDDIEFYSESEQVSSLGFTSANDGKTFSCVSTGKEMFRFETELQNRSNVRVDLVSLDGRTETIYNQAAEGKLEFPFQVKSKGVYCVRMTVDNTTETMKIVAY